MTDKSYIYSASNSADMARDRAYEPAQDREFCEPETEPSVPPSLLNTIETEILPRLMLVHSNSPTDRLDRRSSGAQVRPETVETFVSNILDQSTTSGHEIVAELLREGVALENVYLDLLAPAARQMGEMWETDVRNFTDVTIGLCRLHEILRHNTFQPRDTQISPVPDTPSVLLSTACDDQHVFGIIMVAEFFRKENWQVTCEPGASNQELSRIVALHNYDVIGLSIARSIDSSELSDVIQTMRKTSRNPDVKFILGGAAIQRDVTIANKVGADGAITDAAQAPGAAMTLLAHTRIGC